jgi:IS1 family transposase
MIDERTVREWLARAGSLGKFIQKKYVCNGKLELGQVQADELCINTQKGKVWMATAMSVFSRLFIWGVVSVNRSQAMIEKLMKKVKSSAKSINDTILFSVDGFKTYPKVILKTFRIKVYSGKRGRPRYKVWENIHIAQVIKSHKGQKLTNICRKVFYGSVSAVYQIIAMSQVVFGLINTSFIERLNATFRSRMPSLVRKTRNLALLPERLESEMFWSGVVYNFCTVHSSLGTAPAVAAGLTSEVCSIEQLLRYKIPK